MAGSVRAQVSAFLGDGLERLEAAGSQSDAACAGLGVGVGDVFPDTCRGADDTDDEGRWEGDFC